MKFILYNNSSSSRPITLSIKNKINTQTLLQNLKKKLNLLLFLLQKPCKSTWLNMQLMLY